jgi:hypothetical protein
VWLGGDRPFWFSSYSDGFEFKMKKLIGLIIVVFIIMFGFVLRSAYLADQRYVQLLYNTCRDVGCSDAKCKFFAQSEEIIQIDCGNGYYIKKW